MKRNTAFLRSLAFGIYFNNYNPEYYIERVFMGGRPRDFASIVLLGIVKQRAFDISNLKGWNPENNTELIVNLTKQAKSLLLSAVRSHEDKAMNKSLNTLFNLGPYRPKGYRDRRKGLRHRR